MGSNIIGNSTDGYTQYFSSSTDINAPRISGRYGFEERYLNLTANDINLNGTVKINGSGVSLDTHEHGTISSTGRVTTTVTAASGDAILIADSSDTNAVKKGPSFGTSTTTYLRNNGTWETPPNTTYSAMTSTVYGLGKLFSDTAQSIAANAVSATASRTYGIQKNASGQLVLTFLGKILTHLQHL